MAAGGVRCTVRASRALRVSSATTSALPSSTLNTVCFSPDEIWLCGGSAGGHLALWTLVNLPPEKIAGCVSISSIGDPVPDFRTHPNRYTLLLGPVSDEAALAAMSPIPLIRPGMAPLLCTHADADQVVPIASHRAFANAYRAAGNRCDFFEYPHDAEPNTGGHFIWRPEPHRLLSIIEERIAAFVRGAGCETPGESATRQ